VRHFEGREDYETAVDELLPCAQSRVWIFEPQLGTRFNSIRRQDVLRSFLLARRANQLKILVHDASAVIRNCARLTQLLRQFSHAIFVHETSEEAKHIYDPFCVTDSRCYVRRFHYDDFRGVTSTEDEATAIELSRRFEEMWELSFPAVTATLLGL
jgi:uncharacterized protein YeeX (DUF496 family)